MVLNSHVIFFTHNRNDCKSGEIWAGRVHVIHSLHSLNMLEITSVLCHYYSDLLFMNVYRNTRSTVANMNDVWEWGSSCKNHFTNICYFHFSLWGLMRRQQRALNTNTSVPPDHPKTSLSLNPDTSVCVCVSKKTGTVLHFPWIRTKQHVKSCVLQQWSVNKKTFTNVFKIILTL